MPAEKERICPVRYAGSLDNRIRKWIQDPKKILGPYIKRGMIVLDLGCGPGFFTVSIAEMVGQSGKVIAADVQDGMLKIVQNKIKGTDVEKRIHIHKCDKGSIGFSGCVDLVLAMYVIHEISNVQSLFMEIHNLLKDRGYLLIVEPKYIHVSKKDFEQTVRSAVELGFEHVGNLNILLSRGVVLRKYQTGLESNLVAV
jgi:ubiquinone/menaquinone biosynthesis C-methylase UbiE